MDGVTHVSSVVYQAPTDRVSGLLYMGQSLQITFTGEFSENSNL